MSFLPLLSCFHKSKQSRANLQGEINRFSCKFPASHESCRWSVRPLCRPAGWAFDVCPALPGVSYGAMEVYVLRWQRALLLMQRTEMVAPKAFGRFTPRFTPLAQNDVKTGTGAFAGTTCQKRKRLGNRQIVKPFLQSGWLDSNQRPHAPQTCTLKSSTPLALNTLAFYLTRWLTSRLIRQSKVKHQWTIGNKQSSFAYQQSKEKAAFSRLSPHPLWIRCNPTTTILLLFSCICLLSPLIWAPFAKSVL